MTNQRPAVDDALKVAREFVARRTCLEEYANTDLLIVELSALLERREREAVAAHVGRLFPIQRSTPVPWAEAERAYRRYAELFGNDQTLERLAQRGGFGVEEFACLWWGHDPTRCKVEKHPWPLDRLTQLEAELAEARGTLGRLAALMGRWREAVAAATPEIRVRVEALDPKIDAEIEKLEDAT